MTQVIFACVLLSFPFILLRLLPASNSPFFPFSFVSFYFHYTRLILFLRASGFLRLLSFYQSLGDLPILASFAFCMLLGVSAVIIFVDVLFRIIHLLSINLYTIIGSAMTPRMDYGGDIFCSSSVFSTSSVYLIQKSVVNLLYWKLLE